MLATVTRVVDTSRTGDPLDVLAELPSGDIVEVETTPGLVRQNQVELVVCPGSTTPAVTSAAFAAGPDLMAPVEATMGFLAVAAVLLFWVLRPDRRLGGGVLPGERR